MSSIVSLLVPILLLLIGGFGLFLCLGFYLFLTEGGGGNAATGLVGAGLIVFTVWAFRWRSARARRREHQAQVDEWHRIQRALGNVTNRFHQLINSVASGSSIVSELSTMGQASQIPSQEFRNAIVSAWREAATNSFKSLAVHPRTAERIDQVRAALKLQTIETQALSSTTAADRG